MNDDGRPWIHRASRADSSTRVEVPEGDALPVLWATGVRDLQRIRLPSVRACATVEGMTPQLLMTKHAHACVTLDKSASHILIDPGAFTPNAAELVLETGTILITHEHFDHFDEEMIGTALEMRSDLKVYGPAAVVNRWHARPGQTVAVAEGDCFSAEGFDISVFGDLHAPIHRDIPRVANVGFLVDGTLYHPGDAYFAPPVPIRTLLLPTSGPWTNVGQAADYVRAVSPEQVVQIHEIMLSEIGQQSMTRFLGPEMLTSVPLTIVPVGDAIAV